MKDISNKHHKSKFALNFSWFNSERLLTDNSRIKMLQYKQRQDWCFPPRYFSTVTLESLHHAAFFFSFVAAPLLCWLSLAYSWLYTFEINVFRRKERMTQWLKKAYCHPLLSSQYLIHNKVWIACVKWFTGEWLRLFSDSRQILYGGLLYKWPEWICVFRQSIHLLSFWYSSQLWCRQFDCWGVLWSVKPWTASRPNRVQILV